MIVSEKALPAFSVSERTAEAKWKGDAAGVCGPAPSALLRGFPGGAEVKPGGVPISLPAGAAPLAAGAAGNTVADCCGRGVYLFGVGYEEDFGPLFAHPGLCAHLRRR